jgi:hypothetical protein
MVRYGRKGTWIGPCVCALLWLLGGCSAQVGHMRDLATEQYRAKRCTSGSINVDDEYDDSVAFVQQNQVEAVFFVSGCGSNQHYRCGSECSDWGTTTVYTNPGAFHSEYVCKQYISTCSEEPPCVKHGGTTQAIALASIARKGPWGKIYVGLQEGREGMDDLKKLLGEPSKKINGDFPKCGTKEMWQWLREQNNKHGEVISVIFGGEGKLCVRTYASF